MRTLFRSAALAATLGATLSADLAAQGAPGADKPTNPACELLTDKEIDAATGLDYGASDPVDDAGGSPGRSSCLWGGASFAPGESRPQLGVMLTSLLPGVGERPLPRNPPSPGCTREILRGVGDEAYLDHCEKSRGPVVQVKVGRHFLMLQADARRGQPLASAKPVAIALAKAAATRVKGE